MLVKICQAPTDPCNPELNWEFVLRVVDETGKGLGFESALPDMQHARRIIQPPLPFLKVTGEKGSS